MTAEELKIVLSTPLALFLIMLSASLLSALKQLKVAKRDKPELSLVGYFTNNLPETLSMIGHNIFAFGTLIMTDSLNWAAALGIGYLANDAADMWTKEGRSFELGTRTDNNMQAGFGRVSMLAFLLAIAATVLLAGCATGPNGKRELTANGRIILSNSTAVVVRRYVAESDRGLEKAANIRAIAAQLYDATSYSTITDLRAAVDARVKALDLAPDRRAEADNFMNITEAVLREIIGRDEIDGNAVVKVNDYLAMVVAALPPPASSIEK